MKRTKPPFKKSPLAEPSIKVPKFRLVNWLRKGPWLDAEKRFQPELEDEITEYFYRNCGIDKIPQRRKTQRLRWEAISTIMANLVWCDLMGLSLAVSRDTAPSSITRRPNDPSWLVGWITNPILDALEKSAWVCQYRGKERLYRTRLVTTKALSEFCREYGLGLSSIRTDPESGHELRLKDHRKTLLTLPNEEVFNRNLEAKSRVLMIDPNLLKSLPQNEKFIKINREGGGEGREEGEEADIGSKLESFLRIGQQWGEGKTVKLYDWEDLLTYRILKTNQYGLGTDLYRVFNRIWLLGGRFYGADHINLPRFLRHFLTLDGEPVIELDYHAMHLNLLYGLSGHQPPNREDLYAVPGLPRDLVKLVVNRAFNAPRPRVKRSLVSAVDSGEIQLPPGMDAEDVLRRVEKEFQEVVDGFYIPDIGQLLVHSESDVLAKIFHYTSEQGITIHSIHDGVLAPVSRSVTVREAMDFAFRDYIKDARGDWPPRGIRIK